MKAICVERKDTPMTVQQSVERSGWRVKVRRPVPQRTLDGRVTVPDASDPARRPDVLLRVRRAPDAEPSPWWNIGAFVAVSASVVLLMNVLA